MKNLVMIPRIKECIGVREIEPLGRYTFLHMVHRAMSARNTRGWAYQWYKRKSANKRKPGVILQEPDTASSEGWGVINLQAGVSPPIIDDRGIAGIPWGKSSDGSIV